MSRYLYDVEYRVNEDDEPDYTETFGTRKEAEAEVRKLIKSNPELKEGIIILNKWNTDEDGECDDLETSWCLDYHKHKWY